MRFERFQNNGQNKLKFLNGKSNKTVSLNKHLCIKKKNYSFTGACPSRVLQSIYVTRDRVILKFEARVQIYMAVLNIGCKIQNFAGNVVSFSKINSCEISF